jgi:thiol-disulfide isomerase/thioredoxin
MMGTKDEAMKVGWFDRMAFDQPEYHSFMERYDTVALDQDVVELIRSVNSGVDFLVFLGTWCGDSRREVPHFLKIADRCGIEASRIRFYGLDRSKKSTDGLTDQYQIEKVPTLIFLRNGAEIGRITEKPTGTLEANMLSILAGSRQN